MRADLSKKMITVFTPTYNRAYIIGKLYESLKRQTFKDFEWLVIDDGSVDNTENLIQGFILENEIEIRYIKKDNGGQHTALNKAIECAKGHLLMIVDSDDYLTDTALERILYWENTIAEKEGYAGISGLRAFPWGDTIGGKWKQKENYVDATNLERKKYRLRGDKAEAYYTNVLRQYYPIPVFAGENDVEKGVLWNRIANGGYKLRWFNKVIYIGEYRTDGLSAAGPDILTRNPIGWGLLIQLDVMCKRDIEYSDFQYYRYYQNLKDKFSLEEICANLNISSEDLLAIVANKPKIIYKVNKFFSDNNIKRIALYGMGGEAKRFLQMSKEFNVEICYGIDRSPNSLLPVCFSPTDTFPDVDAIIITNRMGIEKIKSSLKDNTKIKCISLQKDILEKGLNYYYSDI